MKPARLFWVAIVALLIAAAGFIAWNSNHAPAAKRQLRVLGYVGYDEPDFLAPLEQALDTKIVVDTYVGGEEMYTKLTQAPRGTYDIVVLDAEYGERLFAEKHLIALDRELWHYEDLFSKFQNGEPARAGSSVYAAVARWGALGIVFNTQRVDRARLNSYAVLYASDLKGRIGIYDWYLPNMGILSLSLGNPDPYNVGASELAAIEKQLLQLRSQITSIQPNPGQVLQDLRDGKTWVAPGIGEWAAAALATEGLPIDWVVPQPGGIMWVEAFAIASHSNKPALARQFLQEVMKPTNLALLATRKAYYSQVTRTSAYAHVPELARRHLRADELQQLAAVAEQLQFRHLPGPETTEKDWIAIWTRFKAAR